MCINVLRAKSKSNVSEVGDFLQSLDDKHNFGYDELNSGDFIFVHLEGVDKKEYEKYNKFTHKANKILVDTLKVNGGFSKLSRIEFDNGLIVKGEDPGKVFSDLVGKIR
jgi:hypothetical protein